MQEEHRPTSLKEALEMPITGFDVDLDELIGSRDEPRFRRQSTSAGQSIGNKRISACHRLTYLTSPLGDLRWLPFGRCGREPGHSQPAV
jgi:hypothetical protein